MGLYLLAFEERLFLRGLRVPRSDFIFLLWLTRGASKLKPLVQGLPRPHMLPSHVLGFWLVLVHGASEAGLVFNLGPSHQCFFHHQGSVLPSIPKIGRLAGAGTKSLLEGEIKRKIAGKEFFPENLGIFQGKKTTFLFFFFGLYVFHS